MNLVEEEPFTGLPPRENRRYIASVLKCRSGGDAQRCLHLRGDDGRQRSLAQPRRTAQKHVIGWTLTPSRSFENQTQLGLHPLLADEIGQPRGPQCTLDCKIFGQPLRIDNALIA